jgi:subtilase family serine protease
MRRRALRRGGRRFGLIVVVIGVAGCATPTIASAQLEGSGELGGWSPQDIYAAYKLTDKPEERFSGGSGQTIAVLSETYGGEERDLATYRGRYGLGACTRSNGCFRPVNAEGREPEPSPSVGLVEEDLDLEMVSATCPECKILDVVAVGSGPAALAAAANEAVALGATEITTSNPEPERAEACGTVLPDGEHASTGCAQYLADYSYPGVEVFAAAGDYGYESHKVARRREDGVTFPGTAPTVVSVGGTTLKRNIATPRGWEETVWNEHEKGKSATTSGCSVFALKPLWQTDPGCPGRTDNDIAMVAANLSEVVGGTWRLADGTSASAPLLAGTLAHADSYTRSLGPEAFYVRPEMLFDVTKGGDGGCAMTFKYLCHAEPGYDGPTGWGTPDGVPNVPQP